MVIRAPDRPARRDAVRNRARLVDAATTAFREDGLGASVNAIARAAGVNVATLYRHFETKDHLIAAVLEAIVEPLVAARDHALATAPPDSALATFLTETLRVQGEHQGLLDALRQRPFGDEVRRRLRTRAIEIAGPIVGRAHRDGELRADLDAEDVLVAVRMLSVLADSAALRTKDNAVYVDVVLRGLRPR